MSDPIYFAPLRVPLVDTRTGLMSREWYLFFQALWLRTGGTNSSVDTDGLLSITDGLAVTNFLPSIANLEQSFGQVPLSELGELSKEVLNSAPPAATSELEKMLQDLGQVPSQPSQVLPHLQYGSWTPSDASGAGLSFTVDSATYIKHERLVFTRCVITYPATANGSTARIGGLPFPLDNVEAACQGWVSWANNSNIAYYLPVKNTSNAVLYNSAGTALTNAQVSGNTMYLAALYSTP